MMFNIVKTNYLFYFKNCAFPNCTLLNFIHTYSLLWGTIMFCKIIKCSINLILSMRFFYTLAVKSVLPIPKRNKFFWIIVLSSNLFIFILSTSRCKPLSNKLTCTVIFFFLVLFNLLIYNFAKQYILFPILILIIRCTDLHTP